MISRLITIGRVGKPYGVKGWVKIHAFTTVATDILAYQPWRLQRCNQQVWDDCQVCEAKVLGHAVIVKFSGYDSPEAVKVLTQALIAVHREQLPKLDQQEYYWADLMGLQVVNVQGVVLGKVTDMLETGANDVFVVTGLGNKTHLIPYTRDAVLNISLESKTLHVDWDPEF